MVAEYLEKAINFERMAAEEADAGIKGHLLGCGAMNSSFARKNRRRPGRLRQHADFRRGSADYRSQESRYRRRESGLQTGQRRLDVVEFMEIADAIGFDAPTAIRRLYKIPKK